MTTLRAAAVILLLLAAWISPSPARSSTGREWTTDSFLGFVQGTLEDGGANTYVAADGTVRLVNLWDLNQDGNLDLVLAATHDNNEKLPLTIYWQKEGFAPERRTELPTEGAKGVALADCNRDGRLDLVVANGFDGTRTELDSYVYWGSPDGFAPSRRTTLRPSGRWRRRWTTSTGTVIPTSCSRAAV